MHDFLHTFRQLARHPGYTVAATLILALGLGANTAMFSFADGLLLRPLALPGLDRLMTVWLAPEGQPQAREAVSGADYLAWKQEARSFTALAALQSWAADLTGGGNPERLSGARVTGDFFSTLGIQPLSGRLFDAQAEAPGANDVVVLSQGLWRRRFGTERSAIGRSIRLNERSYTVLGVVPSAQAYPVGAEFWVPLTLEPGARNDYERRDLELVGRVQAGVSPAGAEAELRSLASHRAALRPHKTVARLARSIPLRDHLLANSEVPSYLLIVFLAATFLLALACANVANLEVAQMHGRLREFVIRSALGGGLGRLARQVLTESTVLCGLGGAAGLVVAHWTIELIRASLPADLLPFVPGWTAVGLNPRAFGFAAAAALLAGLLAGIAPMLMLPRRNLDVVLRQGARGSSGGGKRWLRHALVIVEVALAMVLVVACGLVVKTFADLVFARHGFESDRVLSLRISLPGSRYAKTHEVKRFFDDALREISSLPGVEAVSIASTLPFYSRSEEGFGPVRTADDSRARSLRFNLQSVSPDYFRTFRMVVLQGRSLGIVDSAQTTSSAVVSKRAAEQLWPGESPLGRTFWQNPSAPDARPLTVVGVVTDVRHDWRGEAHGTVYLPFAQAPQGTMFVSLLTLDNPVRHIAAVRSRLQQLDAAQPLPQPKTMKQVVVESMAGLCITAGVLTFMGLVSLLVAGAGVYSVVANSVSQRTRELGIRMALGARPSDVRWQVLGEGFRLVAIGVALGLPVAVAVSVLFRHAVQGIPALEAVWFALLALLLLTVTLVACYPPARRASGVDPMVALRHD